MSQKAWDEKSATYPKFDGALDEFRQKVFDYLDEAGVKFQDKTIVDIGCGTGLYTLFIAKFAKSVLAVDFSQNMLLELENSAKKFFLKNVKTMLCDLENFDTKDKFDIAILTMSPAIQNEKLAYKFLDLADTKIYLNWQKPRTSSVLERLFLKFKRAEKARFSMSKFLTKNDINFKRFEIFEKRISKRSLQDAIENASWHLAMNGADFNQIDLKNELLAMQQDGFIYDEISVFSELLIFKA